MGVPNSKSWLLFIRHCIMTPNQSSNSCFIKINIYPETEQREHKVHCYHMLLCDLWAQFSAGLIHEIQEIGGVKPTENVVLTTSHRVLTVPYLILSCD